MHPARRTLRLRPAAGDCFTGTTQGRAGVYYLSVPDGERRRPDPASRARFAIGSGAAAQAAQRNEKPMRYADLGLLILFFVLIPWLAYRFGHDSREGIESDEYQRHRSRGA